MNNTTLTTTLATLTTTGNASTIVGHSLSNAFAYSVSAYFLLIVVCSLFFNLVLMCAIVSEKKLHTITNIYVFNLAIGDLITAMTVVPFDIDYMLRGWYPYGKLPCAFKDSVFLLSLPSSVVNLLLMTVERFVSIHYPFKRIKYFNKRNVAISITLGWLYTLNVCLFPIYLKGEKAIVVAHGVCIVTFPMEYAYYQVGVNFVLPIIFILGLNVSLFSIANRHQKEIQRMSVGPKGRGGRHGRRYSTNFKANIKTAKTVVLLVGNFLICWLSYIILTTDNILCKGCHSRELTWVGNAVNYSNIVFNPLLYGLMNKSIRAAIIKTFRKICAKGGDVMKRADSSTFLSSYANNNNNSFRGKEISSACSTPSRRRRTDVETFL